VERRNLFLDEATKTVTKGFVVGAEKRSLDHGFTAIKKNGLFIQSIRLAKRIYCIPGFCSSLPPDFELEFP
jgi:hypothetical protein